MAHWEKKQVEKLRAEWRKKVVDRPPCTFERWFEMPRKWTFQMPKLRKWVEDRIEGHTLNLFGGITRLSGDITYNDLNPDLTADYRRDAYDLAQWSDTPDRFDTVIFDPPYTAFQAVKTYGGKRAQEVSHARDVVEYVLKPGGRVLSLGFNSTGMSESRGYLREALALVNCGGSHNDFILVCERHIPYPESDGETTGEAGSEVRDA